ncbi:MAG TPA: tetratricopeptide repeat protein [Blastocatellia bacterium]|nr:tetratricopeptide repeat protein [Blastocatellia bacterium]
MLAALIGALIYFRALNQSRQARSGSEVRSIAVLPFKSLGAEDSDPYLELGIADALITRLSNLRKVVVRPTSAVRKYDGQGQDPAAAGRELKVEAVLDGNIQKVGDRAHITVQLVRALDGAVLWAESFDDHFSNVLSVQDSISESVAEALSLRLTGEEKARLAKRHTENTKAYQAYLKGRYFWNRRTPEALRKGIEYFQEALKQDPSFAPAYAGLADSYSQLSDHEGLPPRVAFPEAVKAATKALELDEQMAEAHASLAYIKAAYQWDWAGAEREFQRALELNPNYATARQWYAEYLCAMGRHEDALAEIRKAQELDPTSLIINAIEAWILYYARQYDQAIEQSHKVIEMEPNYFAVYEYLKRCYDQKGMYKEAIAARQMRRKLLGYNAEETAALRAAAAAPSARVYWQKRLEQEMEEAKQEGAVAFDMAEILAQLGRKEQAFAWLEKAYEERSSFVRYLKVAPNLDPLRSDQRFQALLRRVNLAP